MIIIYFGLPLVCRFLSPFFTIFYLDKPSGGPTGFNWMICCLLLNMAGNQGEWVMDMALPSSRTMEPDRRHIADTSLIFLDVYFMINSFMVQ